MENSANPLNTANYLENTLVWNVEKNRMSFSYLGLVAQKATSQAEVVK